LKVIIRKIISYDLTKTNNILPIFGTYLKINQILMTTHLDQKSNIKLLERQLEQQQDNRQRLVLLDQLASHYTYTNVRKGQKCLAEIAKILEDNPNPDFELNYHKNTALIENQLYNYTLAEQHFQKSIEIVEERGDIQQQVDTYIDYSGTCLNLDKREMAKHYLEEASKKLKAFPDNLLAARITCRSGFLSLHVNNYTRAIELLLEAEKNITAAEHRLTLKDYYFLALIYSGLGRIYEHNGNTEKSVKAYLKGANLCETIGMRTRMSWHYLNVGKSYLSLDEHDSAESFFSKAIQIQDDISQDARAGAYANLGYCYYLKQNYEAALELFGKAENLYIERKGDNSTNLSRIECWKAQLYADTDRHRRAERHFFKAFEYVSGRDFKQLSDVCQCIAEYHADLGNFKTAYEYLQLYNEVKERHHEEVNERGVMEMQIKYETEKSEQEAEMLRLQATGLQLKALRAQMNPHFMYNALNSIQNFITSEQTDSATRYLAKFAKLMRQSLEYSDLEMISLEKEIDFLEDYLMLNQKLRFENFLKYEINLSEDMEEDIMGVPTMIIQPYVENAIEHGLRTVESGMVRVNFSLADEDTILCVIEDNGIGREVAKERQKKDGYHLTHKSRGTSITEQRLRILHKSHKRGFHVKTIDLRDQKGKGIGTRVEVKIPIIDLQIKI